MRRFFTEDHKGNAVDPDTWYEVQLLPREGDARMPIDYVLGEDLLACAEFYDQLMSQGEDDNG